jgi:hypothetical protein
MGPIQLTLLIGPTVAVPAPPPLLEALDRVEVTHSDEGRSGFQLTFRAGRTGIAALIDYPLLLLPLLRPFNRVILVVTINARPRVLMDGVITHHQVAPTSERDTPSTITVTGEDVSVMMDLEEKTAEHPAQPETVIALKLIGSYAQYGLIPIVIPPLVIDPPIPIERVPVQQATDLRFLEELAARSGYVFYVAPGPAPFTNQAYWGPPQRTGLPQRALSANLGSQTNVESIQFANNALGPTTVAGRVQDRTTNQDLPVQTPPVSTRPPLAVLPTLLANQPNVRTTQFRDSGVNAAQALARAQGIVDSSADSVTAQGELDAVRYGDVLQARSLVDVRGVGFTNNGTYYVKRVSHTITQGAYRQSFTLTREGTGALRPLVVP